MKWNVTDKLVIGSLLPEKGSMFNMALCRDIRKKTQLTADEIKDSGLQTLKDGSIVGKTDLEIEIDFTEDEIKLLSDSAQKIKDKEEVTEGNLELIEKLLNG